VQCHSPTGHACFAGHDPGWFALEDGQALHKWLDSRDHLNRAGTCMHTAHNQLRAKSTQVTTLMLSGS
jgi:hypothetical protein